MTIPRMLIRWGGLILLGAVLALVVATGWWRELTPQSLQREHVRIFAAVAARPATSAALFFAVCAAVSALCLPGPGLLAVIGGALFGWLGGGLAAVAGFTVGALPTFFAFRAAAGKDRPAGRGKFAAMTQRLRRHAFTTLLAIRLAPVAPIGVVTIAAGLARTPPAGFLAATFLGCAPAALVYAALGHGLRHAVERGGLISPREFADPKILLPLGLLAAAAAGAAFIRLRRGL